MKDKNIIIRDKLTCNSIGISEEIRIKGNHETGINIVDETTETIKGVDPGECLKNNGPKK